MFQPAMVTCPDCGGKAQVQRCASVNADNRPDLRTAILEGRFQATTCPACGQSLRLPPHLVYLELGRRLWIAAEPAPMTGDWGAIEQHVFDVYDRSFGLQASAAAAALGEGLVPRLVFGWPALREKLVCEALGLDDVTLELLKMALIRNVDGAPMADETELRLVGADAEALQFRWMVAATEQALAGLSVPRDAYDAIEADAAAWQQARAGFDHVFLVDLRRLLVPVGADSEAA